MQKLRKFIRETTETLVLSEERGNQKTIHSLKKIVAKHIYDMLLNNFDTMKDVHEWEMVSQIRTTKKEQDDIGIKLVTTRIFYTFLKGFDINGSFQPGQTILEDDGNFSVSIKFTLESNYIEGLLPQIEATVAHELNHAFVGVKQYGQKSKSQDLITVNNFNGKWLSVDALMKKYPDLREFKKMVYLANDQEVQARVQQAATELEHMGEKDPYKAIEGLMKFNPMRDARMMMAYNLDKINLIDKGDLKIFVDTFNDNLRRIGKNENHYIKDDVDEFFKYWLKRIKWGGRKLSDKIFKLVSEQHNIHEGFLYENLEYRVFNKIFGNYFEYND